MMNPKGKRMKKIFVLCLFDAILLVTVISFWNPSTLHAESSWDAKAVKNGVKDYKTGNYTQAIQAMPRPKSINPPGMNRFFSFYQSPDIPVSVLRVWYDPRKKQAPDVFIKVRNLSSHAILFLGYSMATPEYTDYATPAYLGVGYGDPTLLGELKPLKENPSVPSGVAVTLVVPGRAYKDFRDSALPYPEKNKARDLPKLWFDHLLYSDGSGWGWEKPLPRIEKPSGLAIESVEFVPSKHPQTGKLKEWDVTWDDQADVVVKLKSDGGVFPKDIRLRLEVDTQYDYKNPFGCDLKEINRLEAGWDDMYQKVEPVGPLEKNGQKPITFKGLPLGEKIHKTLMEDFRFWIWGVRARALLVGPKYDPIKSKPLDEAYETLRVVENMSKAQSDAYFIGLRASTKGVHKTACVQKRKDKLFIYPMFSSEDYFFNGEQETYCPSQPFKALEVTAPPAEIGRMILEILSLSSKDFPYMGNQPVESLYKPLLGLAGVKTWKEFKDYAVYIDVFDDGKHLDFTPFKPNGEEIVESIFQISNKSTPEQIGKAVLKALSKVK